MNNGQAASGLLGDLAAIEWDAPSGECAAIAEAWADVRDLCLDENPDGLTAVEARLAREWALDVALAERLVDVDRGLAFRLAANGFDAAGRDAAGADMEQWEVEILSLLRDVVLWLLDRLDDEEDARPPLDPELLEELHRRLRELERFHAGDEPPAAEDGFSAEKLQQIIDAIPPPGHEPAPELVAAWLLHGLGRLRPFGNLSDRVARAAASYSLMAADLFPLTVRREDRNAYSDACAVAHADGLAALRQVVATSQRRSFLQGVSTLGRVPSEPDDLTGVISVISDQFRSSGSRLRRNFADAMNVATEVFWHAKARIAGIEADLVGAIDDGSGERRAFADYSPPDHPERRNWHRKQVIDGVRRQGYFANLRNFSAWNRIGLDTPNGRSEILLSFHAVGQSFRGVVAGVLIFYRKRGGEIYDHQVVSREPFQVNFRDTVAGARRRFDAWLEPSMRAALEVWRRGE
ncbi:MAG: Fic family protein [Acidimicrobiia bacterium]|nr:Fic family protein [Acidimicrobiia bacterium]